MRSGEDDIKERLMLEPSSCCTAESSELETTGIGIDSEDWRARAAIPLGALSGACILLKLVFAPGLGTTLLLLPLLPPPSPGTDGNDASVLEKIAENELVDDEGPDAELLAELESVEEFDEFEEE